MALSSLFRQAALPLALVATLATGAGFAGLRYEWNNNRFAACVAEQVGGKAGPVSIRDLNGEVTAHVPVLRTYGLGKIGVRPGVIVENLQGPDKLSYVLEKQGGEYKGHWDFVRVAGKPLPSGTWSNGPPSPSVRQISVGNFAQFCANNPWVDSGLR